MRHDRDLVRHADFSEPGARDAGGAYEPGTAGLSTPNPDTSDHETGASASQFHRRPEADLRLAGHDLRVKQI